MLLKLNTDVKHDYVTSFFLENRASVEYLLRCIFFNEATFDLKHSHLVCGVKDFLNCCPENWGSDDLI